MVFDAINAMRVAVVKFAYDAGYLDKRLSVSEHISCIGKLSASDFDAEVMVIGDWRDNYCVGIDKLDNVTVYFESAPMLTLNIEGAYKECLKGL